MLVRNPIYETATNNMQLHFSAIYKTMNNAVFFNDTLCALADYGDNQYIFATTIERTQFTKPIPDAIELIYAYHKPNEEGMYEFIAGLVMAEKIFLTPSNQETKEILEENHWDMVIPIPSNMENFYEITNKYNITPFSEKHDTEEYEDVMYNWRRRVTEGNMIPFVLDVAESMVNHDLMQDPAQEATRRSLLAIVKTKTFTGLVKPCCEQPVEISIDIRMKYYILIYHYEKYVADTPKYELIYKTTPPYLPIYTSYKQPMWYNISLGKPEPIYAS